MDHYYLFLFYSLFINLVCQKGLRHDRNTVSLLTDKMVFFTKYGSKVLVDEDMMVVDGIQVHWSLRIGLIILEQ